MNWLAAPFGSAEDQLLTFGLKDVDYTLDDNGNPTLTPQGNNDANYVPWKYTTQHPFVFFSRDLPGYTKVMADTEQHADAVGGVGPHIRPDVRHQLQQRLHIDATL